MRKIHLLSLFSGIGAFEVALKRAEIPFTIENYSEIDTYASKAYSLLHDISEEKNLGDITKISQFPENIDLLTYGFPCQDISSNGKKQGLIDKEGNQTRSGLFFDALKIIETIKPKIAIAENVKHLTSKRFNKTFELVLKSLEEIGYTNFWKVLDAKDFNVPQSRARVFIVSIRNDYLKENFQFPEKLPLTKRIKDILDEKVDEKYNFVHSERARNILNNVLKNGFPDFEETDKILKIGNVYSDTASTGYAGNIWDERGICSALQTMQGGGQHPLVIKNGVLRKYTPKECFRLMGFSDEDFSKIEGQFSDSRLYKMAGNSIVVDVLVALFKNLNKFGYL